MKDAPRDAQKDMVPALEAAAEAGIASLLATIDPTAGVVGAAVVAGLSATKGMQPWLNAIRREAAERRAVLDPSNPRLVAAFHSLTVDAMQTSRDEKRELLAAALLNSGPN